MLRSGSTFYDLFKTSLFQSCEECGKILKKLVFLRG